MLFTLSVEDSFKLLGCQNKKLPNHLHSPEPLPRQRRGPGPQAPDTLSLRGWIGGSGGRARDLGGFDGDGFCRHSLGSFGSRTC